MPKALAAVLLSLTVPAALAAQVSLTPRFHRLLAGRTVDLVADYPAPPPGGAAAPPVVTWQVLGAPGHVLAGNDLGRRTFLAQAGGNTGVAQVQVTVRQPDGTLVGEATATLDVAGDPGLDDLLMKTVLPHAMSHAWMGGRPYLSFLADPFQITQDKQVVLPEEIERLAVRKMQFLDDPAMGDLHRTALVATTAGLFGLTLQGKLIPVPAAQDLDISDIAVRPPDSLAGNPHHVAFLVAGSLSAGQRRPAALWVMGPDGVPQERLARIAARNAGGAAASGRPELVSGLAMDPVGNLYVGVWNQVLRIDPEGAVEVLAGSSDDAWAMEQADGKGAVARFGLVQSLVYQPREQCLYALDSGILRRISLEGEVTTVMGDGQRGFETIAPAEGEAKTVDRSTGRITGRCDLAVLDDRLLLTVQDMRSASVLLVRPSDGRVENLVAHRFGEEVRKAGPVGMGCSAAERGALHLPPKLLAVSPEGSCYVYLHQEHPFDNRPSLREFAHLDLASYLEVPAAAAAARVPKAREEKAECKEAPAPQ